MQFVQRENDEKSKDELIARIEQIEGDGDMLLGFLGLERGFWHTLLHALSLIKEEEGCEERLLYCEAIINLIRSKIAINYSKQHFCLTFLLFESVFHRI